MDDEGTNYSNNEQTAQYYAKCNYNLHNRLRDVRLNHFAVVWEFESEIYDS